MSHNSIASLKTACEHGFWGTEFDVNITADGQLLVFHDSEIDGKMICEHNKSEFDGYRLPNGEPIPLLDEYLALAKDWPETTLVLELKPHADENQQQAAVDGIVSCLKSHGLFSPERVIFISFSMNECRLFAKAAPGFTVQYLGSDSDFETMKANGVNGIDMHLPAFLGDPKWKEDAGETLFDPALLTFQYPYQRETTMPAKLTATQLKGRALDQEIAEDAYHTPYIRPLVQPKFRREKKGLTPAERGTATHLVLQYLDLQNLDVPGQVEKLRLEAKLTAEQAAAVDVPALRRFLESPLAEEMRQAKTAAREYRFTVLMPARDYDPAAAEEDSILLQGVVDCWFETPKGVTVVDFKTDFVQTEEDVAQHAELYRGQLAAYSLALERVLEKAVTRKTLYFLQAGKTVEIS